MEIVWYPDSHSSHLSGGLLERMYAAVREPARGVILFSRNPEQEVGELIAAIRLLRGWRHGPGLIVAATSHPSEVWLHRMRGAGTHQQWAVVDSCDFLTGSEGKREIIDICRDPCPMLHTLIEEDGSLSVCGARQDRMVLAMPQFRRWCLNNPMACPYFSTSSADMSPFFPISSILQPG